MFKRFTAFVMVLIMIGCAVALATEYPCEGVANASSVRVRKKAASSGKQVTTLKKGETVQVLGETVKTNGDIWYQVETENGKKGYVLGDYLSIPETALIEAAENSEDAIKMKMTVKASCKDYNSVGKNWTQYHEWNGIKIEDGSMEVILAPEIEFTVYSRIREQDSKPDTSTDKVSYLPTAEEIENGFTVTQKIEVTENGGKYKNNIAYWTVTFTFEPMK